MKRKCCCLILNYNDSETTVKLVNSIKNYSCFAHILVVDNHSTDLSWNIISRIENIVSIRTAYNGGYGAGNNFGIKYAKEKLDCDYVLLSNPDVIFSEKLVKGLIETMKGNENCALVSAVQCDIKQKEIKDKAWKLPGSFRYALAFTKSGMLLANIHYSKNYFESNNVVEVDCIPGAMLLIDVDKFLKVGGYDEEMFLYCEEDTIAYKIKTAGYKTLLVTNSHYIHEHGVSINKSISDVVKRISLINKNKLLFMKKYLKASPINMLIARFGAFIKIVHLKLRRMRE